MKIWLCLIFIVSISFAKSKGESRDALNQLIDKVGIDQDLTTSELMTLKDIKLDNPFIIHVYTMMLTNKNEGISKKLLMKIIKKENKDALKEFLNLENQNTLAQASRVYLLYQNGFFHLAINEWMTLIQRANYRNSPIQISLEQILGKDIAKEIAHHNFYLTAEHKELIQKLPSSKSAIYKTLLALSYLNQGEESLKYLKYLPETNPIRIELAKSAVVHFARIGELAKAASVLKSVFKPYMEKSSNVAELVDYYLMLARLLYQANAYDASEHYYSLIPENSPRFLQARIESLWISYIKDDFSKLKGQVVSLEDELIQNRFMPELYLMSSSAKVKLCQFNSAKKTMDQFVTVYKDWANKIKMHARSDDPELVEATFNYKNYAYGKKAIESELKKLKQNYDYSYDYSKSFAYAQQRILSEKKRQWLNRGQILSNIIRKMRFVKVEYISLMKRFRDKAITEKKDEVHLFQAKSRGANELVFPYDGDLWGDDYFNINAQIESSCLQGMRK